MSHIPKMYENLVIYLFPKSSFGLTSVINKWILRFASLQLIERLGKDFLSENIFIFQEHYALR